MWNAQTGKAVGPKLRHRNPASTVTFSPNGRFLVTGEEGARAYIWDIATGEPIGSPLVHASAIWDVAVANDGRTVLTGSNDGYARVWRIAPGTLRLSLPQVAPGGSVAFTRDSRYVAVGIQGDQKRANPFSRHIRLWDRSTGEVSPKFFDGANWTNTFVKGLEFSPDGKILYAGTRNHVVLWNTDTQKSIGELKLFTSSLQECWRMALSPDGKKLAARGGYNAANPNGYLWNAVDLTVAPIRLDTPGNVTLCVAFSPDSQVLWTGHREGIVRRWDATSGQEIGSAFHLSGGSINAITVRPDGQAILVSTDEVRERDVQTGDPVGPPFVPQGNVTRLTYAADGEVILTGSTDHAVRIWHTASGLGSAHYWAIVISSNQWW
jgi:WD40 repeat protein